MARQLFQFRAWAAVALLAAAGAAATHPGSISRTRIDVRADGLRVELRVQAQTLFETLPLDADGDGRLALAEVEAGRAALAEYVAARLRVVPLGSGEERAVPLGLDSISTSTPGARIDEWYLLALDGALAASPERLAVETRLFLEQNPDHVEYTAVAWEGEEPTEVVFGAGEHRAELVPQGARRAGVLGSFLRLGVDHILSGWDHLAFVLALLVAVRGVRPLVGVVTAFTVAHSVTLALAAFEVVRLPSNFVELAIALSIAYVALDNLLRREAHAPWLLAFAFGLVHGLGFAGFLSSALAGEPLKLTALLGFNLGVEAGQLLVVVPIALVLLVFGPAPPPEPDAERWLAPRWLRVTVNVAVAALGLYLFTDRAGWLG
jgi:hypothetical protein